jgi:hypothetical protein
MIAGPGAIASFDVHNLLIPKTEQDKRGCLLLIPKTEQDKRSCLLMIPKNIG